MLNRRQRSRQAERTKHLMNWQKESDEALPNEFSRFVQATDGVKGPVYGRVSSRNQGKGFMQIIAALKARFVERGIEGIHWFGFSEHETGKSLLPKDRPKLFAALRKARDTTRILLVPCFSRLLRHPDYHPIYNPDVRPTREQLEELDKICKEHGVTVHVLNDLDASPREDVEFMKKLEAEGNSIKPRRMKKNIARKLKQKALKMKEEGQSFAEIAAKLKVSKSIVQTWIE